MAPVVGEATAAGSGNAGVLELSVKQGVPSLVAPAGETQKGSYFLSNVDQVLAGAVKTLYCFEAEHKSNEKAAEVLKEALAKVLVHYYPLAGRLAVSSEGKLVVDCTGEGAVFVEADADCSLGDIGDITKLDLVPVGKLLYSIPGAENVLGTPLLVAQALKQEKPLAAVQQQVTRFKCGGFTLGLVIDHCMFDATGALEFMNSWGETARGLPLSVPPYLDRTVLRARIPPKIEYPHHEFAEIEDLSDMAAVYQEEFLFRSFCFDPEKLQQIKEKATEDGVLGRCTTFEALSGYVWRARTRALRMRAHQPTKLAFLADVRTRFDPPLPKGYFGNGVMVSHSLCAAGELLEKPLSFAVGLVQKAVRMVTEGYTRSAIDYVEVARPTPTSTATHVIAAWSRLRFHAMDFGWGQPVQCGPVALPHRDTIVFLSHGNEGKDVNVILGLPASTNVTFQELMNI